MNITRKGYLSGKAVIWSLSLSKLLFYPCDARKHTSGKVFYRFRDLSERIFVSGKLENAYQEIADTLNMLIKKRMNCDKCLTAPSARLEHEFVVEVPVINGRVGTYKLVRENSPTSGNSRI